MRRTTEILMAAGLVLAILISNAGDFISDGLKLDKLRGSVLRLHILANSDSERDQELKLKVRDKLLRCGIFEAAEGLAEAEEIAEDRLKDIVDIAEAVLRENGCSDDVTAELADVDFDDRTYGDITMPSGRYRALRIKIGEAEGHNWWCVMYPPLCLPAAFETDDEERTVTDDKAAEESFFDEKELDMLRKPRKYKVRFAIWDKIKSAMKEKDV